MVIYKALLKYGYSNFKLEILEYCDCNDLLVREQFYLDLLSPEYNILKTAGSSFGFQHSQESKRKMSEAQIGRNRAEGSGKPSQNIVVFDNE